MKNKGVIYTYSIVNSASEQFSKKVPYVVVIVDTGDRKFLSRIDNYDQSMDIKIGREVELLEPENGVPLCKLA